MLYDDRVEQIAERALPVGRYSVQTLNWVRMPAAGARAAPTASAFGLDEILDGVAGAGFHALGLDDLTVGDLDPAKVASALRRGGLSCSEVGILRAGDSRETSAAAHDLAWLAQETGASCCITILADPPPADPVAALEVAAAVLDAAGVRMALEFAAYGSPDTLAKAIALCDTVGWERCGLLLDSWHVLHGDDPWQVLESLDAAQIALVHLNDAPRMTGADPVHDSRFRREAPGDGALELERFLDVLSRIGYRGAISLEVLSSRIAAMPPASAARGLMTALVRSGFVEEAAGTVVPGPDPKEASTCL